MLESLALAFVAGRSGPQIPAQPGSIREKPCSRAQRSIAIEARSSTSGIGRMSRVRSIDFTYRLQVSHASSRTAVKVPP